LADTLDVDRVTIGRWERGETDPQPHFRPRLAKALNLSLAELDAVLWTEIEQASPVQPEEMSLGTLSDAGAQDDMIRREFLRLVSLSGALVAFPQGEGAGLEDSEDLAEARLMTSDLWQVFSRAKTKQAVYPLVREQISDLNESLGRSHREATHRDLCQQTADLFQLAGEIFFDGNRYTDAAQCYALAASASKEAGNSDLWAASLTRHSFIGLYERQFADAVPMLDAAGRLARHGDSQLSTRYWVSAVQAQVYAGLGEFDACKRALDQAEEVQGLSDPCPGGWLRFDGSRLPEERGSCYVALGRLDLAEEALNKALSPKLSLRRQGSVLTDLAAIGAGRRDVDRLLSYGSRALELARKTNSGYVERKLKGLQGQLSPFLADKRVSELHEHISALGAV
jgi:tetratricopeptide (TPR) repeat protein